VFLCSLQNFFIVMKSWTTSPKIKDRGGQLSKVSKSHLFLLSSLPIDINNRSKGMLVFICLFFFVFFSLSWTIGV
jgi:hypothetical protein